MKPSRHLAKPLLVSTLGVIIGMSNVYAGDESSTASATASQGESLSSEIRRTGQELRGAARDAWLHGKLEASLLLNRHLNNFTIDSRIEGNTAHLSGTVESEIDKALAEQVALSIDGIETVRNELSVDRDQARRHRRDDRDAQGRTFAQRIDDATTTAAVKTKLLTNRHTDGLDVNVDTRLQVVTLKGEVNSSAEKDLAEQLAGNTDDVRSVVNELRVVRQDS